jgi:hypothetical protein
LNTCNYSGVISTGGRNLAYKGKFLLTPLVEMTKVCVTTIISLILGVFMVAG